MQKEIQPKTKRVALSTALLFVFISFFLFGGTAHAAISLDSTSNATVGASGQAVLSWSHSVSGTNRVLVVGVSINGNQTVSSVTYGGTSLTRLATVSQSAQARASLWYLLNPFVGTQTITVTMTGNDRFVAGAHSYTGVNQTNPLGFSVVNTGSNDSASSLVVTSGTGELVVDVIARRGDLSTNPLSSGSGQSQRWNTRTTVNSSTEGITGGGSSKSGANQVTMSWTWPNKRAWATAGISLKPVPPPGDTTPPLRFNGVPSGVLPSGTTQTTMSLNTDENATCRYDTSQETFYASMPNTFSTTGGTTHSKTITGLSDDTDYDFYIKCIDGSGNSNGDDLQISFSVDAPPPEPDTEAPSTPTNLTAEAISPSEITLLWDASTDNVSVTGYKVFRDGDEVASTVSTSYADTGLSESTSYTYRVSAFDEAGNESAQSSARNATTPAIPPPPPEPDTEAPSVPEDLLAVELSESEIDISWSASTDNVGVVGYRIFRDGEHIFSTIETTFSDVGLSESTSYTYRVSAFDEAGNESGQSSSESATTFVASPPPPPESDTTPPLRFNGVPSGVLPSGTTQTTMSLNTDENATCRYDTSQETFYASMPNTFSTTGGTTHSKTITGLSDDTDYDFYIKCIDGSGNSNGDDLQISFSVAPFVDTDPPSKPTGLVTSLVSASDVVFSWQPSTDNIGVQGYKVFRDGVQVASTIKTSFTGVGVTALTTYSYTVSAFDALGNESAQSSPLVISTPALGVVITGSGGGNNLPQDGLSQTGLGSEVATSTGAIDSVGGGTTSSLVLFTADLFFGLQNSDVEKLQRFLAQNPALYPEGIISGYFGPLTQLAVQRFQCLYNIVCSGTSATTGYGRVGPLTRAKLNELLGINPVTTPQLGISVIPLRFGMSSPEISRLQTILAQSKDIYPEGIISGYFGPLTQLAVQRFQCQYNIVCGGNEETTGYGLVGPKTKTAINQEVVSGTL